MDQALAFVLKMFSEYYSKAGFSIPEIEKREFGAGTERKIDSRHMGFANEGGFRSFLVNRTPLYVSHSVAYYRIPAATPMEKKGWLGADLVFDLDFETESKYLSKKDFENIRADAIRLVEEFVMPDFGVSKNEVSVNFSGNRGFHIHVRDTRFRKLRGDERREIMEYIRGMGLKYGAFFETDARGMGIQGPAASSGGYKGRFAKKILSILEAEPKRIIPGFRNDRAGEKYSAFVASFAENIRSGNWSQKERTEGIDNNLRRIAENELPLRTVNADAGVTQDVSKLIRVPNSLHGSTGLCAKILDLGALPGFEPMHHAYVFSGGPVKIAALEDIPEMEMGNSTHEKIAKGERKEVPEYLAIYLELKGSARLVFS